MIASTQDDLILDEEVSAAPEQPPRPQWFSPTDNDFDSPPYLRLMRLPKADLAGLGQAFIDAIEGRAEPRRIPGTSVNEVRYTGKHGTYWMFYTLCMQFDTAVCLNVGGGPLGKNRQTDLDNAMRYQVQMEELAERRTFELCDDQKLIARLNKNIDAGDQMDFSYTLHALFCLAGDPPPQAVTDANAQRIWNWANFPRARLSQREIEELNAWLEPTGIDLNDESFALRN